MRGDRHPRWRDRGAGARSGRTGPGATPEVGQLAKHCGSLVAGFKVPRSWELVEVLPTSPTGKVLKRELRKPHWEDRERQVN